jgi:hypothetical protein
MGSRSPLPDLIGAKGEQKAKKENGLGIGFGSWIVCMCWYVFVGYFLLLLVAHVG